MSKVVRNICWLVILPHFCLAASYAQSLGPSPIQCSPASRCSLFRESDIITIQATNNLDIQVTDLDGAVVYQGAPTSLQLTRGHYFVTCSAGAAQFAVLPDDYAGAPFLGMEAVSPGNDTNLLNAVHPTWLRMLGGNGTLWNELQPQAGSFDWSTADQVISNNVANGRKIIWVAFLRPPWLIDDAQFISLYTNYVGQVARRYGSQLYAIEIWNEPWTTCDLWARLPNLDSPNQCMTNWHQMVESYLSVLQAARTAIKSVAPSLQVIGPAWTNPGYGDPTTYLTQLGGATLLDALTFHDYSDGGAPPDQDAPWQGTGPINPCVDENVERLRSALGSSTIPMLVDEVGLYGQSALGIPNTGNPSYLSGISWRRGMYRAAKLTALYVADGVQAIIPHVLCSGNSVTTNYLEIYGYEGGGRGPHPKTSSYLMTGYWLNNATLVDFRTLGKMIDLYAWRRPDDSSIVFAWTVEGQSVPLNSSMSVMDIFGRPKQITALTEEPVLFATNSPDASALLATVMNSLAVETNLPPVLEPIANQSVLTNEPLQFAVAASDPDHDPITYSVDPLPPSAAFDASSGAFSWTPDGSQVGDYQVTFTVTDARGLSTSAATTISVLGSPDDGLIDEWNFDESSGTTALDSVGSNTGLLQNFNFDSTDGWVPGVDGNALDFDGINDYVALDSTAISLTNNFTVTAWLCPKNPAAEGAFLSLRCSYPASGLRFFVNQNSLDIQGQTPGGWQTALFADGQVLSNTWQHVAIVYDKSMLTVYLNGVSQGSTNWGGDFVMDANQPSKIGTEGSYFYEGAIDDLRIYDRTLSANEIQTLVQGEVPPTLAAIGAKQTRAGELLTFTVSTTDPEGDPPTYSASSLPSGATFNAATRAFSWTPTPSQVGRYSVRFAVTDGQAADAEDVSITVTAPNHPPVLKVAKHKRVRAGHRLRIRLSAKDRDHDLLICSMSPMPDGATFDPLLREFDWIPTPSQVGLYTLTATVSDAYTNVSRTVTITVH